MPLDVKKPLERATWSAVLGLLATTTVAGCTGYCPPEEFPEDDPCHGKAGCDVVEISLDGGAPDVDGGTTTRFCGCCNG